ncbi:MAG TPA: alpha/beta hydrolase-fold protein [Mycobacteriales bacterium]|nr:alpha/beta hydrolase-fold protein [Mycobacteriales bacterium]
MLTQLSVVSPWFALGVFAAAGLTWAGWRRLHLRRARAAAVAVLVIANVLSVASVATAVNDHYAYLPTVGDLFSVADGEHDLPTWPAVAALAPAAVLRAHPRGVVVRLVVPDRGSGFGASRALVYLPPQYFTAPARRFPVVYLFHGSPGVPGDWFRGGAAGVTAATLAAEGRPLIVVAPRMSHGWQDDPECVDGRGEKVESHFVRDVVPTVDELLRTVPDRTGRIIGGMSAGGYCALNLGLRHRALVGAIIDLSGDTQPTHTGGLAVLFGTGPAAVALARANTPAIYAASVPADPPDRIWFDCGADDLTLLPGMHRIEQVLAGRGLRVQLHVRAGGHTFHVWRPALADALTWLTTPN